MMEDDPICVVCELVVRAKQQRLDCSKCQDTSHRTCTRKLTQIKFIFGPTHNPYDICQNSLVCYIVLSDGLAKLAYC